MVPASPARMVGDHDAQSGMRDGSAARYGCDAWPVSRLPAAMSSHRTNSGDMRAAPSVAVEVGALESSSDDGDGDGDGDGCPAAAPATNAAHARPTALRAARGTVRARDRGTVAMTPPGAMPAAPVKTPRPCAPGATRRSARPSAPSRESHARRRSVRAVSSVEEAAVGGAAVGAAVAAEEEEGTAEVETWAEGPEQRRFFGPACMVCRGSSAGAIATACVLLRATPTGDQCHRMEQRNGCAR